LKEQQELLGKAGIKCGDRREEGDFINSSLRLFKKAINLVYDKKNGGNPVLLQDIPGFEPPTHMQHTFDVFKKYSDAELQKTFDESLVMKTIFDAWVKASSKSEDTHTKFAGCSDFTTFNVFSVGQDYEKDGLRFQYMQINDLLDLIEIVKFDCGCEPLEKNYFSGIRENHLDKLKGIVEKIKRDILKNANVEALTTEALTTKIKELRIAELTQLFETVDPIITKCEDPNITCSNFLKNLEQIFDAFNIVNSTTALGILNSNKNGIYKGDVTMTKEMALPNGFSESVVVSNPEVANTNTSDDKS
jgi:hypothetical protein